MTSTARRAGRPLRLFRALAALLVLGVVLGAHSASATDRDRLEYGARTALREASGASATTFRHGLEPGLTVVDAVVIVNYGREPARFDVYARDMVPASDGSFAPAARSESPREAGTWVNVDSPSVEIGARESMAVSFTIEAPIGTPPGHYTAVILVEPDVDEAASGVTTRTRIALPIELEVLGDVNLGVGVGALHVTRSGDEAMLEVEVTNTGDVSFSGTGIVEVEGWTGARTASFDLEPSDVFVAPGDTVTLRGVWGELPLFGRFTARSLVTATVGDRQPRSFASEPLTFWIIPWALLITLGAVVAIGVVTWRRTQPSRQAWLENRSRERELVRDYRRQHREGGVH